MPIDTRPVETLDDARRLGDLVYSTYGLTYHRSFMYDPHRLLELNASRNICSMMAVDRDSGAVVGHQATIRPWFEIADALPDGRGAPVSEVGLSIVHPQWRGHGIQNHLALALLMHIQPANPDARGYYIKCLCGPVRSQRSARRFTGRATCLFVAGVPAWVVCDATDTGPRQPLTTILVHCPYGDKPTRSLAVPARHKEFLQRVYGAVELPRKLRGVVKARAPRVDTEARTWFDPARRHGVVRVIRPGGDLVERVLDRVRWMTGGHIEHVTTLLPLTSPHVAASVPALEAEGLFVGGVIPDLEGQDTLVLEWVDAPELDTSRIEVVGEDGEFLRDYVLKEWRAGAAQRSATG